MAHAASRCRHASTHLLAVLLTLACVRVWAASAEELFFKGTAEVNEGQLRFLSEPPDKAVHSHYNQITIDDQSLVDGWVGLYQCHEHLDAVPSAQVVYRQGRVRNLEVVRTSHIGRAWVEGSSVQLQDVQHGAVLCIRAQTQALSRNDETSYNLSNGPYMRKFLDGYYPMRVSLRIRLETDRLRFVESIPEEQPGFRLWRQGREIGYDAVFEGVLNTVLRFDASP